MRILIVCTANSCRSQISEAFLKELDPDLEVFSAGITEADEIHPKTIQVMKEVGMDISNKKPVSINQYLTQSWDFVVTVCDDARETCPSFHGVVGKKIHYRFIDPVTSEYPEYNRIDLFRAVRDEIRLKVREFYNDYIKE
ncbi:MAG: arsenate reductase ArsC [Bacteroidota bacterium]